MLNQIVEIAWTRPPSPRPRSVCPTPGERGPVPEPRRGPDPADCPLRGAHRGATGTMAARSDGSPALELRCTTVAFIPKGSLGNDGVLLCWQSISPPRRDLPSGRLGQLQRPAGSLDGVQRRPRDPRVAPGRRASSFRAARGLPGPDREASPRCRARRTQLPPYPFFNSLFPRQSLLISAAYLYLPGSASLRGDTRRP